jgi:LysR family transcriptional activator of nhaA
LAVLPPIAVRDELASGTLVEFDSLAGLTESFFAVTVKRRFPKTAIAQLLKAVIE